MERLRKKDRGSNPVIVVKFGQQYFFFIRITYPLSFSLFKNKGYFTNSKILL